MANSFSTTSFTLRAANGGPAVLGSLGLLMMNCYLRDGWYEAKNGIGVFTSNADRKSMINDIVGDLVGVTVEVNTLVQAFTLYGQRHLNTVTEGMLQEAACVDELQDDDLGLTDIVNLSRLEPGADINDLFMESGVWTDKRRHGGFGGDGWYWSPVIAMGIGSGFPGDFGPRITAAASQGNANEIAQLILDRLVQPATYRLPTDLRKQVQEELEGMLGIDNPKRVIVSVRGGVVQELRHNVKGMSSDILDWDCGGVPQEIEEEAEKMPYSM